ncbi:ABC-type branched-chain amino acid transport system, periplasmic component [Rivularia sp. PCC 7116]|uniref:ABC transporter substrate-binding protein n=1 Tax=Rivularia sp. PCC 7116 TaxID=373994 RepID=UPI00029ED2CC|nr:ABC transporter substrate-binding protein [Rivularia sp. PCC 7116]AFY59118.1 ABC-type branched-chain amino acid transport system, periplasmic component [Rivularia sp. PCC 7116]
MNKLVVLNIDEGSFEQGFPVRLGIGEDGRIHFRNRVTLPPAPEIPRLYQEWQDKYRDLGENIRQIDVPSAQVTRVSIIEDENQARNIFENYLNEWLSQLSWRELRVSIEEKTQPDEFIRVIIDTHNIYLKKLPWHLWQLFDNRPHAEFALSADYAPPTEPLKRPVKILAIFGDSEGLDLTSDRELIATLSRRGAKVTWLEQPQRSELSESLWKQHWDILFFAGHSSSGEECKTGQIQINNSESISLNRLRNTLRTAVRNGLKLAIFNSCDGLGLADELRGIGVPQMIVMREPVPDEVARQFLKYFLEDFSQGHSLYVAVRNARQRLEWMEDNFPCASWLPVICQNPAARPLLWAESSIKNVKKIVVGGVAIALIFAGNYIRESLSQANNNISSQTISATSKTNTNSGIKSLETLQDLGDNFSWGEKILIRLDSIPTPHKDSGVGAFANKNFIEAAKHFKKSLNEKPNDPETLIYLNNAVTEQLSRINLLPIPNSLKSNLNTCEPSNNTNNNPSNKILKIAVPVPISAESHIARDLLRGVAQAQNEINCKGGINGRLLQVMIVDDKDNKSVVENVAQKLVKNQEILAVAGHYSSSSTLQAGKIYDGKIVAVSPTSNALRKSEINQKGFDFSEWVFRVPPTAVEELVDYMVDVKGYRKAAIVYVNREWSKSTYDKFKNDLESKGGEVVSKCELNGNFRARKCLYSAIDKKAEVMLFLPEINQNTIDKALELFYLNNNNPNKLFLLGGTTIYSDKILKKSAENVVAGFYWHRNEINPGKFERDASTLWKAEINGRAAMSYDATMVIVEGLKRMGNNPTRQRLKQVLSQPDFFAPGAAGKVEFENGDRKITRENESEIGVLVQVKCDAKTPDNCKFVRVPQQ